MSRDTSRFLIMGLNGPIRYTCTNARFQTDRRLGFPHGSEHPEATGSYTPEPLITYADGGTLWLEYVVDRQEPDSTLYWLMWYYPDGTPAIPMSSVFSKDHLQNLIRQLIDCMP